MTRHPAPTAEHRPFHRIRCEPGKRHKAGKIFVHEACHFTRRVRQSSSAYPRTRTQRRLYERKLCSTRNHAPAPTATPPGARPQRRMRHVRASHGQSRSRIHCKTCRCPPPERRHTRVLIPRAVTLPCTLQHLPSPTPERRKDKSSRPTSSRPPATTSTPPGARPQRHRHT